MKSHCIHGHEYTPNNILKNGKGLYRCKACLDIKRDTIFDDYERYEKRREYIREWQRTHKHKITVRVEGILSYVRSCRTSCTYCGESHPGCLDFHHKDPREKDFPLTKAHLNGRSLDTVKKEIVKCDVICSNCHRKLHYAGRIG